MKVTVCQFHDDPTAFEIDWQLLVAHVRVERSDFVLLPEMPFFPWFATSRTFDAGVWNAAVKAHRNWEQSRRFKREGKWRKWESEEGFGKLLRKQTWEPDKVICQKR
jgi:hypothetical protein